MAVFMTPGHFTLILEQIHLSRDAMCPQHTEPLIDFRIIGGDHPTFAGCNVFYRVKRENGAVRKLAIATVLSFP